MKRESTPTIQTTCVKQKGSILIIDDFIDARIAQQLKQRVEEVNVFSNCAVAGHRILHEDGKVGMVFASKNVVVGFREEESVLLTRDAELVLVVSKDMTEIDVEVALVVEHHIVVVPVSDTEEIDEHQILSQ